MWAGGCLDVLLLSQNQKISFPWMPGRQPAKCRDRGKKQPVGTGKRQRTAQGKPINFFDLSLDFFFFDLVFYRHLFFSIFVLLFYPCFFAHVISSLFYLTCLGLKNLIIIIVVVSIDFFDFLLDFFLPLSCPWLRHVRRSSAY
jgi:hypothetical protein